MAQRDYNDFSTVKPDLKDINFGRNHLCYTYFNKFKHQK